MASVVVVVALEASLVRGPCSVRNLQGDPLVRLAWGRPKETDVPSLPKQALNHAFQRYPRRLTQTVAS